MKKIVTLLYWIFVSALCIPALAQTPTSDFEEDILIRFRTQLDYYPQEKTYLHLDRSHYISGDTVWFRGYVVDALTHRQDTASRYLYVDLVNPSDSVALQVKVMHR